VIRAHRIAFDCTSPADLTGHGSNSKWQLSSVVVAAAACAAAACAAVSAVPRSCTIGVLLYGVCASLLGMTSVFRPSMATGWRYIRVLLRESHTGLAVA